MMAVQPALPPYGHLDQAAMVCVAQAAARYQVPELLLHAILEKEGGRKGSRTPNRNGTHDLGWGQINSSWLPYFARYGITEGHLTQDFCVNVHASAYILRKYQLLKRGDLYAAIVAYNIGPENQTPARLAIGMRYAQDVVARWWKFHRRYEALARPAPLAFSPGA